MLSPSMTKNNRLIRKTIAKMYPSSFAFVLTGGIALMVDTLLAGKLLGEQAIAAVAIVALVWYYSNQITNNRRYDDGE